MGKSLQTTMPSPTRRFLCARLAQAGFWLGTHLAPALSCAAAAGARPGARPAEETFARRLVRRLKHRYLRPAGFQPSAMRYPLRMTLETEWAAARRDLEKSPDSLELRCRVARLADEAQDSQAAEAWRRALDRVSA
ncbi:MAG: hypothetical protein FJX77_16170, partial [Armatimonadetes bacterium]|nr:hypothetical protein [Armatimonadota bacterium]